MRGKQMKAIFLSILFCLLLSLSACVSHKSDTTLYEEIGGLVKINEIVENFIDEIGNDKKILPYFEDAEIDRFRDKLSEHLCEVSDGPCIYSGDSMIESHTNMNITEDAFNHTVDLLINAMTRSGLNHRLQNRLLKRLAPMRKDIIYRNL